jgi:hypothetical protein
VEADNHGDANCKLKTDKLYDHKFFNIQGYYTELLLDQIRNSQEEQQTPNITQVHECLLSTKSHIFV